MSDSNIETLLPLDIHITGQGPEQTVSVELIESDESLFCFKVEVVHDEEVIPAPLTLSWKIPYLSALGVWKSNSVFDKRQQYDWELEHFRTRISVDAPVISVFGTQDRNLITFACAEVVELVEMNALLREEDNHLYCHLTLFKEAQIPFQTYQTLIRIDLRGIPFFKALNEVAAWWQGMPNLQPAEVPALARLPLYSTWYNFHQHLDPPVLLKELAIARQLGFEWIILDDGWQTHDGNRGYDFTGDWQPERIPHMAEFVQQIHALDMKVGLWFSVPFCGKKSQAYQRFAGKFLTENHRWAPVFDPRFPEVRQYLVNTYVKAVADWGLDALKLDFIDDFMVYPETTLGMADGRDTASVNEAVDILMTQVIQSVQAVNSEIAIEFRQKYVGPAMKKFGHMFRAFDSPNDPITNRVRITDVKLLSGRTAVHSDPITWHSDESLENAALQFVNALFAVPQLSMELGKLSPAFQKMVRYFTEFWRTHQAILLDGTFTPYHPLNNYPVLSAQQGNTLIAAIYDQLYLPITPTGHLHLFNGSDRLGVAVLFQQPVEQLTYEIIDCQGTLISQGQDSRSNGLQWFEVPIAGRLSLSFDH